MKNTATVKGPAKPAAVPMKKFRKLTLESAST